MEEILKWISEYSLPVVILIALGAAFVYLAKMIIEKAISQEFDKQAKTISLQLERRSKFEEMILLERFTALQEINAKLMDVATDIRRFHAGTEIQGLIVGDDLAPLTEVFNLIEKKRYLIAGSFHQNLTKRAQILIEYANATDQLARDTAMSASKILQDIFHEEMTRVFGIEKIDNAASETE